MANYIYKGKVKGDQAASSGGKKSLSDIKIPNSVAIVMIAGIVLIVALVFIFTKVLPNAKQTSGPTYTDTPAPDAVEVEILPHSVRNFGDGDETNPFASENLGAMTVTGIITNSNGQSTAIVETKNVSYILQIGDTVAETTWTVSEIGANYVTFENNGSEKTFYMNEND